MMKKTTIWKQVIKVSLLLLLAFALIFAWAPPAPAAAQDTVWQASYWDNTTLSGAPVLIRSETNIDNRWGNGSPVPNTVPANRFSARWTRTIDAPAGNYRFTLTVDDGARLWVNGRLLIDAWEVQAATTYSQEIYLDGTPVPVRLDYFENTGVATVDLDWQRVDAFTDRWQAEYFNNPTLSGTPDLVRDEATVDFNWGTGSPAPAIIGPNTFSARWTRTINVNPGQYRFIITVDDGARLWVNDTLLIDAWQTQAATIYQVEATLNTSQVPIRMEYFENGGIAQVQLDWVRIHDVPAPGPGTVVDNESSGFVMGGPDSDWQSEPEGYANSLLWTQNSSDAEVPYNWGRWYPDLTPGVYEVEVYIPFRFSTTSQARYWISHADDYTLRVVNQSNNGDSWVSLGTYTFSGTGNDFVSLADVTFEAEGSRLVVYDAVRWTPVR